MKASSVSSRHLTFGTAIFVVVGLAGGLGCTAEVGGGEPSDPGVTVASLREEPTPQTTEERAPEVTGAARQSAGEPISADLAKRIIKESQTAAVYAESAHGEALQKLKAHMDSVTALAARKSVETGVETSNGKAVNEAH